MKTIEPKLLTSNEYVNKLILSCSSIEDLIVVNGLNSQRSLAQELFECLDQKLITKNELDNVLYSGFEIQEHLDEYGVKTLELLVSYDYAMDQIARMDSWLAFNAKVSLINRFKYLDILLNDNTKQIARHAKDARKLLDIYRDTQPKFYNLLLNLDLGDYSMSYDHQDKICELISNTKSKHSDYRVYPTTLVNCDDNDYSVYITIRNFETENMTDELYSMLCKEFEVKWDNENSLCLSLENITLEHAARLINWYYKKKKKLVKGE